MDIFIEGLEVYGHHGVPARRGVLGQRLLYDVRLTMEDCRGGETDEVDDTVDYTEVLDLIVEVATGQELLLLERLAQADGRGHLRAFPIDEVWVQVTKPHPPVACALGAALRRRGTQRADLEG